VPDFRGNRTKSSHTSGSFGAALTDQVAGSRTFEQLCPKCSPVGCSEDMVAILWNDIVVIFCDFVDLY